MIAGNLDVMYVAPVVSESAVEPEDTVEAMATTDAAHQLLGIAP